MDAIRAFILKYPQQFMLAVMGGVLFLVWSIFLKILAWPLSYQTHAIRAQILHLKLLKKMPSNWQVQSRATDITDLLAILSKNWNTLLPNNKNVRFDQINERQLKLTVKQIDEQALMQWLWAMQKQYAFRILTLKMTKFNQIGMVNAELDLQII